MEDVSGGNTIKRAVGTKLYMPPIGEHLTYKTDIYSLGIILFELLYPFSNNDDREMILLDLRKPELLFPDDFRNEYGTEVLELLIRRLLSHVPDQRPTAHNLIENIATDIDANDFRKLKEIKLQKPSKLKKSAGANHIEKILTSPVVKQIYLATDENQYGVFDASDQYLLIAEECQLKLFDQNGEQVGASSLVHENRRAGYVQRIVWCKFLQKFFILCQRCLFVFTPDIQRNFGTIQLIRHIKPDGNDKLRFIACTNNNKLFINHSYNKIEQYAITTWFRYREWTKKTLNYGNDDEIRRTTCSITDEYLAFNVRLEKRFWVIDFRSIDDNLTLLKRIQISGLTIYHNLQLSDKEWLTVGEKNQFFVLDENYNAIQIDTNVTSESDIYTRFFGKYFIVSTVVARENRNRAQSANNASERRGVINFYD
ncbi:unnamed protein product [Rotaria sordida]|uniref:Protein kinase domain-containing protein n=2 Tax=Rotaria sordida TaxID=392033 RepID=A0A819SLY9_9BILA|nr:unnamed protein product [Rotaria sordida]